MLMLIKRKEEKSKKYGREGGREKNNTSIAEVSHPSIHYSEFLSE